MIRITISSGFGVALMGIGFSKIWSEIPGYWFILAGFIVIVLGVFWPFIMKTYRNLLHGHNKSVSPDQQANDSALFPNLNETALKKHICLIINNPKYSFNQLIQTVALYRGFDAKYVLAIEIPDTISAEDRDDYQSLLNNWADPTCLRFLAADDFKSEVYRNETDANEDPYLDDWMVWTKKPKEAVPQDLVLKDQKWVLYKKTT